MALSPKPVDLLLISALLFVGLQTIIAPDPDPGDTEKTELPSIWNSIKPDKSYHVMFQLQMVDTLERITLEEWASFNDELFRLDLVYGESRVTYLFNGMTNELFEYRPFRCEFLDKDSRDIGLLTKLFAGYSLRDAQLGPDSDKNGTSRKAFGIGPLWLMAQIAGKDSVSKLAVTDNPKHKFLPIYDGYEVTLENLNGVDRKLTLRFYFGITVERFVDAIEWIESGKLITARAKLIQIDHTEFSNTIFDLPVGYGCVRGAQFNHPLQRATELELLHQGGPNQAIFEVTTSRPKDMLLKEWFHQQYTVRLLRGSLKLHAKSHIYYVASMQSRDEATSNLRKIKKVWSSLEESKQSTVYTIENGQCQVTHESCKDHIQLQFPSAPKKSKSPPLSISTEVIANLFNEVSEGYHLIREGPTPGTSMDGFVDTYYEKRMDKFTLSGPDGEQIWSGPVSIVRRVSAFVMFPDEVELSSTHLKTVITIFFYSENYTQILYKTVINLLDESDLDISYMHKQLDISDCFKLEDKQDIVIKYPLETKDLAKKLLLIQELVKEIFLLNLFETTMILPTQVTNIDVTFDNFYMYLKLTIIDLPLSQTFELQPDSRLKIKDLKDAMIEKMTSTLEKCEEACDYYKCYRFSFDKAKLRCRLEVKKNGCEVEVVKENDLYESVDFKLDSTRFYANQGRAHLRPQAILELLQSFVDYDGKEEKDQTITSEVAIPLLIKIPREILPGSKEMLLLQDFNWLEMAPSSVYSDLDSMNEFMKLEEKGADSDNANTSAVIKVENLSNLKVQYSLIFEGRDFVRAEASTDGQTVFGLASYEDCAKLCQDRDCRSFSYCQSKKECRVTNLHETKAIDEATVTDNKCGVFSLDYLSKFEAFGRVQSPIWVRDIVEDIDPRACASACMETTKFACQGFYHCTNIKNPTKTKCLLKFKHIDDTLVERPIGGGPIFQREDNKIFFDRSDRRCDLYSRSYLSQFDTYYDKNLEYEPTDQPKEPLQQLTGYGAETCAQKCIEKSCLAFDVCLSLGKDNQLRQVCKFAVSDVKKSHLKSADQCTTFVLADKSQFNLMKVKLIGDKPDRRAPTSEIEPQILEDVPVDGDQAATTTTDDINKQVLDFFSKLNQTNPVASSHWSSRLLSITLGVLLGVGCVFGWRNRNPIYGFVYNRMPEGVMNFARR